jgi:demethylmenaquinone methyltransferase/2-methoxy-6-polyprenyl-1,4-benzoquinol methylase
MPRFLTEVYRLLTAGGKAGLLCLTRPESFFWKMVYYPYLKFYLPLMGRLISGDFQAYRFLSDSIQTFQEPRVTASMMAEAGFRDVQIHGFTFGAATLIIGKK